jgi:hypothetical protein
VARRPLWRGCGGDEAAEFAHRRRAWVALGIGVLSGTIGWGLGGWGNPADAFDIVAPCALVAGAVERARVARLSHALPRELLVSALLAIPYATAAALVIAPLWGWFALSTSLGEELLSSSQSETRAALFGSQPMVASVFALTLTLYGIAWAWVVFRRQRVLRTEGQDGTALGPAAQELSDLLGAAVNDSGAD